MNRLYSILWKKALGCLCVISELGRSRGKGSSGLALLPALLALTTALPVQAAAPPVLLPSGQTLVSGEGAVSASGKQMTIKQTSPKMILDWQSFNIGKGHSVIFKQPKFKQFEQHAVALNRVIGAGKSAIDGKLNANGKVFLVNPNGVVFGKDANVDVGGLVASTLAISNEDFRNGTYKFQLPGRKKLAGEVVNEGYIRSLDGEVALLGGKVSNEGRILTNRGSTALVAGNKVLLDFVGDGLLSVQVNASVFNALVENSGHITANDGAVLMAAKASNKLLRTVVNNTGKIEARNVKGRKGKIELLGDLDDVIVGGSLDTSAKEDCDGGLVTTSGANVQILPGAKVTTQAARGSKGRWSLISNAAANVGGAVQQANLAIENNQRPAVIRVNSGYKYEWAGALNNLQANSTYHVDDNKTYYTDDLKRVNKVKAKLVLEKKDRDVPRQTAVGKKGNEGDHGGHLIASIFNGPGEAINMVPMDGNLNQGQWKIMENTWASVLKEGHEISVEIKPVYSIESIRPDKFVVSYSVNNGLPVTLNFNNAPGG